MDAVLRSAVRRPPRRWLSSWKTAPPTTAMFASLVPHCTATPVRAPASIPTWMPSSAHCRRLRVLCSCGRTLPAVTVLDGNRRPSGTPAQEAGAFDQWFRSQCRTGGVPVPMTDVTMAHVFDAAQPSAVAPQPHSAPATHTVCRDDVDMGAGLAASGNGAAPVDGFCATVDVASATVPSSSAVHGPQQHGAHRRRRARLRWMTVPSTNGAAPSVLQQHRGLATCWYRWPTSPWGVCRTPCNPPSLSHRACNLLVVRWESTPSVVTTWTWGRVLELPTTASCPCGPRPVGDVDTCFRRALCLAMRSLPRAAVRWSHRLPKCSCMVVTYRCRGP